MYRMNMADAQQQALGFLVSQTTHIESEVVRVRYPDIQYSRLIPVDTTANEWAKSVTFYSMDQVGKAGWFHHRAHDIPLADVTREKFERGIEMAAIGYRYDLEELGQAMMIPGMNLSSDKAGAARRAYEEFVDDKALRGDTAKGWEGLINSSLVTAIVVAADGTGGSPAFSAKTTAQVLRDVNNALTGMYISSLTLEMADTLLLPLQVLTDLATRQIENTTMTILQFIQMHNVYTLTTGQPLTILGVRGLETAGAGGTGRMIAYRRDPQVLKLHLPMPHRFLPIWQTGPITFDIPGIFRFGGVEIRRPGAVRYVDGIMEAPYE